MTTLFTQALRAATLGLLLSYAWSQPLVFAVDVALVLSGVPVYLWWSRRRAAAVSG